MRHRRLLLATLLWLGACASDTNDAAPPPTTLEDASGGSNEQEDLVAGSLSDRPGRILVYEFENEERPLAVYAPDGERLASLPVTEGSAAWLPSWSPSGEWVVWAESPDNRSWTGVRARPGSDERDVVVLPGRPDHLAFAPGEDVVYLLTPSTDGFGLFAVDFANPVSPREVDLGVPYFSDVGASGGLVAHAGSQTRVVGPDGRSEALDDSSAGYQTPMWHPAGRSVVYARRLQTDTDQLNEIVVHDLTTDSVRPLARYRRFAFFSFDPSAEVLAVAVFGRPPANQFQTQEVRLGPAVLPQVGPEQELATGLWIVPLDGERPEALSAEPAGAPAWDPTGEWILSRTSVNGVGEWRAHSRDGRVQSSPSHTIGERGLSVYYSQFWDQFSRTQTMWAPDGSAYAYPAITTDGSSHVWLHDMATNQSAPLAPGSVAFWAPEP